MGVSNCWDVKNCGRQQGGNKVVELGVCPAYTKSAGEACWLVAGTFCGGEIQGTYAEKSHNCMACEVYQSYDLKHRTEQRKRFNV